MGSLQTAMYMYIRPDKVNYVIAIPICMVSNRSVDFSNDAHTCM